ncbi:MAG: pyridoxal 5'-phosphate synthase glutaminase subunit PdxT [Acidimicrobiales bacterium]
MPGGESSTMSKLLDLQHLRVPLEQRLADGMLAFGTCAGMIMPASEVLDGRADQRSLAANDIAARRNGYGRQIDSFEADVDIVTAGTVGLDDGPFSGRFIRAPIVERVGDGVDVLGAVDGIPVVLRHGPILATSFHPELTNDHRLHQAFLQHL